jgi:hypothetical protein
MIHTLNQFLVIEFELEAAVSEAFSVSLDVG